MRIEVADDADALADACAGVLAGLLGEAPAALGLAGASTPIPTYDRLADRALDWARITCWLPDERWVPPDDDASNARMARHALTDRTGSRLLAPETTLESPADAAAAYQTELEASIADHRAVTLLGVGTDGHTASLFPGTAALDITEPGYVANWVGSLDAWRLTATAPLLHASDHLIFLVAGSDKAAVLRDLLVDGAPHPAMLVAEGAKDVTWMLDADAAAML